MDLIEMSIGELVPYKNNPRKIEVKAVDAVRESIKQCGYISPIIVDENNVILAGHTRYRALKEMGMEKVPVLKAEGLTEEQKKKYRILDNRTNEVATWDYQKLLEELVGLDFEGYAFGFEKLTEKLDQDIDSNFEFTMEDFADEQFKHECPECGFRFN